MLGAAVPVSWLCALRGDGITGPSGGAVQVAARRSHWDILTFRGFQQDET